MAATGSGIRKHCGQHDEHTHVRQVGNHARSQNLGYEADNPFRASMREGSVDLPSLHEGQVTGIRLAGSNLNLAAQIEHSMTGDL